MTDHQIGEAAEILNVSTRTLRHWDAVGLLSPTYRTYADYRLYTDADLDAGWEILIYRAAGLGLKEIAAIRAAPRTRHAALERQREVLTERLGHLHGMIRAVDELLERGETMTTDDKRQLFAEARARWGDTEEWARSRQVTDDQAALFQRSHEDFVAELTDARARGVAPGTGEGTALVDKHRDLLALWYDVPRARQVILARMYVGDDRFAATYRGTAGYLLELVEAQARAEGLDPDAVAW